MADRVVEVALQMIYDARSARAFAQMAQEAKKAAKEVERELAKMPTAFQKAQEEVNRRAGIASSLGAYGAANTMGRMGSMAQGLEALSPGNAASALLQRGALPVAFAKAVTDTAARASVIAGDNFANTQQKLRSGFRMLPGGEYVQEKFDQFSGRASGMEMVDYAKQMGMADLQYRSGMLGQSLSFDPGQAGRVATAQAYRGQKAPLPGVYDRGTAEGRQRFELESKLVPLRREELKAERELKGAAAERLEYERQLEKLKTRELGIYRERTRLESRGARGGPLGLSGVEEERRLAAIEMTNAAIRDTAGLRRTATESLLGARTKEAGSIAEVERAKLRTRLEERATRAETNVGLAQSAADALGSMDPFTRRMNMQYALNIKARGTTVGMPQEWIQGARAFGGAEIDDILRRDIYRSPEFAEGVKAFPGRFGTTTDVRGEDVAAQEARRELAKGEFAIDAKLSEEVARLGRDFGKYIGEILYRILETAKSEIETKFRQGRRDM